MYRSGHRIAWDVFGAGERATVRDDPRELPFPRQYPWLAAAVQPPVELGVSLNTVADKHCSRMNATAREDIVVFITRREGKCHEHSRYDELLMQHGDRQLARAEVRPEIDRILEQWEAAC